MHLKRAGQAATILRQRRLEVLGEVDELDLRLRLEALRQDLAKVTRADWISDGACGLWRNCREHVARYGVLSVLDFYHTVGPLWAAAEAQFHWILSAQAWLFRARHDRCRRGAADLMDYLQRQADCNWRASEDRHVLVRVVTQLRRHLPHLDYPAFKAQVLSMDNGLDERVVSWLIQ